MNLWSFKTPHNHDTNETNRANKTNTTKENQDNQENQENQENQKNKKTNKTKQKQYKKKMEKNVHIHSSFPILRRACFFLKPPQHNSCLKLADADGHLSNFEGKLNFFIYFSETIS
jgi:hypothetical protein